MIAIRDLHKTYVTGVHTIPVLVGLNLNVRTGERLAILGKSGSGKSTLLHLLAALERPTSGQLHVGAANLGTMTSAQLARFRAIQVGIVFQAFHLLSHRTSAENVELPLVFAGISPAERHVRVDAALDAVGLLDRRTHRPTELSGGERQRVAIARALIQRPPLLLADEPTGNLDSATAQVVMQVLLDAVAQSGMTLVMVTHDRELAERSTDRIVQMRDGQFVESAE